MKADSKHHHRSLEAVGAFIVMGDQFLWFLFSLFLRVRHAFDLFLSYLKKDKDKIEDKRFLYSYIYILSKIFMNIYYLSSAQYKF